MAPKSWQDFRPLNEAYPSLARHAGLSDEIIGSSAFRQAIPSDYSSCCVARFRGVGCVDLNERRVRVSNQAYSSDLRCPSHQFCESGMDRNTTRSGGMAVPQAEIPRLYAAGATRVYIGPPLEEPERIREEGGPYADVLDVVFPKEKLKPVMAVVRSLKPDAGGKLEDVFEVEDRYRRLMLWWD